ncbi:sensor histidine kinase [Devosia rhizoryzae]|uniref:histidine kinase n=1 Tax=Devosia rhizoryzae TaxID=2774137 RepID=A0ABX7C952_9HYPH|nr:histidine kinase dimerization/phosphoacceptor domain -containing protein [Devosia rhizoryzae]QQR40803.1 sensor histidine kinase [Devosia rhizoryzae]
MAEEHKPVREVRAATVAIALLLLCFFAFAGVFAYFVVTAIEQTGQRLEERAESSARVVATNAVWMAQVAEQTLRRMDAVLGSELDFNRETLEAAVRGLPAEVNVYIIDQTAHTIFSTVGDAERVDVSDRDYFKAAQAGLTFYTSGLLISRITGEQIFVFSRRVQRQGEFAGAVMVSFNGAVTKEFFEALEFEEGSTVSLIRRDGALMARYPAPDGPVDLSEHPLITEHLPQADFGAYFSDTSPIDGLSRVVGYRAVPGTDIVALASIATNSTWSSLKNAIVAVFIIVAPIILALAAAGLYVIRLLRRDAKRRAELEAANETNVMLFREIHHRVKNNLQSVQSLVRMQDMPRNAKIDLQSRLSAMAAMHEHIYRHDRYEDIDAHDLIPVVVNEVVHAYGTNTEVRYDVDHVAVDRDHITPLSLLLSELVTNALKYAFSDGREGIITVAVRDQGHGRCSLSVSDNGVGFGALPEMPTSMGLRLIRGVVSQMGGTYEFVNDNGTRFEADLALASGGHHAPQSKPVASPA